jgi:protein-S-isoprenylcysteine O-methyltransferase Ste14
MLCCMKRMPRTAGVLIWTVGAVATYAVVPFELSQLGGRARPQGPATSAARGAGLLTVAAGGALMTWALAAHYQAAARGWAMDSRLTPEYLLRRGPYRLSRNPMYGERPSSGSAGRCFTAARLYGQGWRSNAPPSRRSPGGRSSGS